VEQEGLAHKVDVNVDPDPIPNPSKHIISSAKLTLNPVHRHNEPGLGASTGPGNRPLNSTTSALKN